MSNESHQPMGYSEVSVPRFVLSMIGWIGVILIFVFILATAYLPNQHPEVGQDVVEQRTATWEDYSAQMEQMTSQYTLMDESAGKVRIPIERAMDLMAQEMATRKPSPRETPADEEVVE